MVVWLSDVGRSIGAVYGADPFDTLFLEKNLIDSKEVGHQKELKP